MLTFVNTRLHWAMAEGYEAIYRQVAAGIPSPDQVVSVLPAHPTQEDGATMRVS